MSRRGITLILLILASGLALRANNVRLRNGQQTAPDRLVMEIAWDHAWDYTASPGNHDAVWLFFKVRYDGQGWQHLPVNTAAFMHQVAAPLVPEPASDGVGLILRPDAGFSGDVGWSSIDIGLAAPLSGSNFEIRVFAIEMVYVPEGDFYLGDGASYQGLERGDGPFPFPVTGEGSISLGTDSTQLSGTTDAAPAGDIPAAWPKGHAAFYAMKYEISQQQYADFLNTLDYISQASRTGVSPASAAGTPALSSVAGSYRNGLVIQSPGTVQGQPAVYGLDGDGDTALNGPADGQTRACNFLSWADLAAYLDWAGLRPMTEFEFEKLCRGPEHPVPGEFAWGTDSVVDANTLFMDGEVTETVTETANFAGGLASHGYAGPQGPLRCGFGGTSTYDRLQAGAAWYGAFELSGNLWELCVSTSAPGLLFTGAHGDGSLSSNGAADVAAWPGADGAGHRGGAWNSGIVPGFRDLAVSDRFYIELAPETRRNTTGGRGVRTWP